MPSRTTAFRNSSLSSLSSALGIPLTPSSWELLKLVAWRGDALYRLEVIEALLHLGLDQKCSHTVLSFFLSAQFQGRLLFLFLGRLLPSSVPWHAASTLFEGLYALFPLLRQSILLFILTFTQFTFSLPLAVLLVLAHHCTKSLLSFLLVLDFKTNIQNKCP